MDPVTVIIAENSIGRLSRGKQTHHGRMISYTQRNMCGTIITIIALVCLIGICATARAPDQSSQRHAINDEGDALLHCLGTNAAMFVSMRTLSAEEFLALVSPDAIPDLCDYLCQRHVCAHEVLPGVFSNHPTNSYAVVDAMSEQSLSRIERLARERGGLRQFEMRGAPAESLASVLESISGLHVEMRGAVHRRCWIRSNEIIGAVDVVRALRVLARIDGWLIRQTDSSVVITIPDEPRARNIITTWSRGVGPAGTNDWYIEWKESRVTLEK